MRTMLAASLILFCTCAHALDDTPTQNVVMGPRGEDTRAQPAARVRQDPPPAHRGRDTADDDRRGARYAPAAAQSGPVMAAPAAPPAPAPPAAASGRQGVQPWLAIRQGVPTERGAQR
ncbi:MAG TPA: hypothetical protein VJ752_05590 [Burkholderiaceae bacterium]|nr:hypothetical protein [Burkholderiaceae bacterium]